MRSKLSSLCFVLLVAVTTLSAAPTESTGLQLVYASTLPQIADGRFAGGSIQTTFVLFNNGDRATDVTLEVRDDDGGPLTVRIPELGASDSFVFRLGRGEIRFLQTDASGTARAGSAQVSSDIRIGVSAILTILDPAGAVLAETGVGAAPVLSSMELPVDIGNGLNTGIALRNFSFQVPVTVTLTLRDSEGVQRGSPVVVAIPGEGHLARLVSGDLFADLESFRGKLEIVTSGRVSALALRQNAAPLSFTTLPVVDSESTATEFSLPQVANHPLARTTFVLLNLNPTESANLTIRLSGDDGEPFPVQFSDGQEGSELAILIPPDGTRYLTTTGLGGQGSGAARIISDLPVGVAAILTLVDESGNLASETGVGGSASVSTATIPVESRMSDTGVALFNPNPEPALVSVRFTDAAEVAADSGASQDFQASGPLELPPFGHAAVFVSEFGLDVAGRTGTLALSSTLPVSALTLRQNGDPLAFTTFPVAEGIAPTVAASSRALRPQATTVDLTTDSVIDHELANGFELTGGILLPTPLDHLWGVTAIRESDGRGFTGFVASSPPRYRMILPAGVYRVTVHYELGGNLLPDVQSDAPPTGLPAQFRAALRMADRPAPRTTTPLISSVVATSATSGVVVEGDTVRNFRIAPVTRRLVTGRLIGLEALPGEFNDFPLLVEFDSTSGAATLGGSTVGENGAFRIELADGRYAVTLLTAEVEQIPPTSPGLAPTPRIVQFANVILGELTVAGSNLDANLVVPDLVQLSGTVFAPYSQRIPPQTSVTAYENAADPRLAGTGYGQPSADGEYRLSVVRDHGYYLSVQMPLESPEGYLSTPLGENAPLESFSRDTVRSFFYPPLPATVTLTGRVTGPSGPLEGILVTVRGRGLTGAPNLDFLASARTDAEGQYTLPTLSGANYLINFSGSAPTLSVPETPPK